MLWIAFTQMTVQIKSISVTVHPIAQCNSVMESPMAERPGLYSRQMNPFIMRCNHIYSMTYGLVCWVVSDFLLKMHFWSKTQKERGAQHVQEARLKPYYHKSDRHQKDSTLLLSILGFLLFADSVFWHISCLMEGLKI